MPEPRHTGLEEFRAALTDYKSVGPWAMGGAVSVPLWDYVMQLGPPWPGGLPVITSVAELLVLIVAFHFWFRSPRKHVSHRLILFLVLLVVCFGAHLYCDSTYTYTAGADATKLVKGFTLRPDVAPLISADFTPEDALRSAEYKAEAVWTAGSITAMRLILLALWLASFVFLSATVVTFVLYYRRRPAG
jgi:hypothetical protein